MYTQEAFSEVAGPEEILPYEFRAQHSILLFSDRFSEISFFPVFASSTSSTVFKC